MALDGELAIEVVDRCIRETGKLPPPNEHPIEMQDTLEKHNIISTMGVEELKTRIVTEPLGVPSLDPRHELDITVLGDVKTTTTVGKIVGIVADKSGPVIAADMEPEFFDLEAFRASRADVRIAEPSKAKGKSKKIKLTIKLEVEGEFE